MYILSWLAAVRLAALLNYHYGNIGMDYTLKRSVPQQIDPSWSNLAWDLLTAIANQASALINPNKVLAEREGFKKHGNCQVGLGQLVSRQLSYLQYLADF